MTPPTDPWLHRAAALPVAFAQVREDALLDLELVRALGADAEVVMIASGGCSAALLATAENLSHLKMVDPNPSQLALAQLKLHLLRHASPGHRMSLLGHSPMPVAGRRERLSGALRMLGLADDALGPMDFVAEVGPDHAGRYERLFAALRAALRGHESEIEALLRLRDPAEQSARTEHGTPLGRALEAAFEDVMALPNLVRLFGSEATNNPAESFAQHFLRRTRHVLATMPAADNPYLWQMLACRFPPAASAPWLAAAAPGRMPRVTWENTTMAGALAAGGQGFDLVHLSNILDWLTPEAARATLGLAWSALRPGGLVFIRQLNSSLDIRAAGRQFQWLAAQSDDLHARDRSFFYRALHLGRRQ